MEFKDFALQYRTDKFTGHTYLEVYEKVFVPRESSAKNTIEIGVQYGGSMQLVHDYFKSAQVYGVDIDPLPDDFKIEERMTHFVVNAYDTKFVESIKDVQFDILIEDGSHQLNDMLFVVKHYSNLISQDGAMIIEDIPSIDWTSQIVKAFPDDLKKYVSIVDNRYIHNRWDDILVVLDKKCNA